MENIPAQPAIPNAPPTNPPKRWPILVILLVILLAVFVIYQAKTLPSKPISTTPSSTKLIKPPTFKTFKGKITSLIGESLTVKSGSFNHSFMVSGAKEIVKTASGKTASASASELKVGKQILVLASTDGKTIMSIILLEN